MSTISAEQGSVARIKRFMVHDGPGIRTVVFLKGCPLRCLWCSSPQTWSVSASLIHRSRDCIRCGSCENACAAAALGLREGTIVIDRSRCTKCGACIAACPTSAIDFDSRLMSVDEVMAVVERDRSFYASSGGGVTFSGGEPTVQLPFLRLLLHACRMAGIHTAIETCGLFAWTDLLAILPAIDLVFFDVKHVDARKHAELTGQDNKVILENLRRIVEAGRPPVLVRVPVIPLCNDSETDFEQIAACLRSVGVKSIELLPFHKLGEHEYEELGRSYPLSKCEPEAPEKIEEKRKFLRARGFERVS